MDKANFKFLCEGLEWTLSDEAKQALMEMIEGGIDKDLAFAILEENMTEEEMYRVIDEGTLNASGRD